jgi:hypothetical protein
LGKYLVKLAESFKDEEEKQNKPVTGRPETSGKRKRLHTLYLLNDIFHHTKYHSDPAVFSAFSDALQPCLIDLIGSAASCDRGKNPKYYRRLDILLDIWKENEYYSPDFVKKLYEAASNTASVEVIKASTGIKDDTTELEQVAPKEALFIMPAMHGDPSTPYYDLPAGNFVPHIIPDSSTPIRPEIVKPLQFLAGPADEKLVTALKKFLKDVDRIYGSDEHPDNENGVDIDELGQIVTRDEITGEVIDGDTYYGWSREFCQQMKKRLYGRHSGGSRSRSRSRSWSRSRSTSPRKRRRYSEDSLSSQSEGRTGWRSGSRSLSRGRHRGRRYDSSSQSRNPSRAGHRSARSRSQPKSRSLSQWRQRSYSPRPASPRPFPPRHAYPPSQVVAPPPPPLTFNLGQPFNTPLGSSTISIPPPPPPPPNYHGPWPPPPPPPPVGNFPQVYTLPGNQYPQLPNQGQPHMSPSSYHQAPWGQSGGRGGFPPNGRGGWR